MQAGKVDTERAARAMYRRHGALGSFAIDVVRATCGAGRNWRDATAA